MLDRRGLVGIEVDVVRDDGKGETGVGIVVLDVDVVAVDCFVNGTAGAKPSTTDSINKRATNKRP